MSEELNWHQGRLAAFDIESTGRLKKLFVHSWPDGQIVQLFPDFKVSPPLYSGFTVPSYSA